MLTFFRRIINSRIGVVISLGILAVIALAFAAGDITGLSSGGGILGNPVATVGGESVSSADVRRRAQEQLRAAQQQQPGLDMAQLVSLGGVEAIVDGMVSGLGLEKFGERHGIRVSRALIGSEIRAIPAFAGPTGQFDQTAYERLIAQRGLSDAQVQREFARQIMRDFLVVPTVGAMQVPAQLGLPYASLLLERRAGQVAFIPTAAVAPGAAPTDAEVQRFYQANVARYTVPERRIVRYAVVTPDSVKAEAVPSDAEIAAAYNGNRAAYAARETRSATLVTVLDQAAATALAARVKGGTLLADAARAAGLEARTVADLERAALAAQTSAAVADAVFAAAPDAVVGPVRGSIGFVVARVDGVKQVPGRSLADARAEVVTQLTRTKTTDALARIQNAIDDLLAGKANITEVAADRKLALQATPALLANAVDPDNAGAKPDPRLLPIMQAGFAAEEGDAPTLVPLGQDGSFAVAGLDRIVRAAPRPLAQVRGQVAADILVDRRRAAARRIAEQTLARIDSGAALPAALAQSGLRVPPPQPLQATRAQLNADRRGVNPTLALLFAMKQGSARLQEAPNRSGWLIVRLDRVEPGDARGKPGVVSATRADLGQAIGNEYAQQFARAAVASVGVKRNAGAVAALKRELSGRGGSDQ